MISNHFDGSSARPFRTNWNCQPSSKDRMEWRPSNWRRALQPDLILLDIGLPKLDGIEAARRIRELAPRSKILFVSQEHSVEVVQAAFSAGASGYVVKVDVGTELLIAVEAVLRGERFVGSRFAGHGFTRLPMREPPAIARRHEAGFYSDDQRLLDDVTQFIGTALQAGNAAIVVATESHRKQPSSEIAGTWRGYCCRY